MSDEQQAMKQQFDRHHGTCPRVFKDGEKVMVELWHQRRIPDTIRKFIGTAMAELDVEGNVLTRISTRYGSELPSKQKHPSVGKPTRLNRRTRILLT